MADVTGNVSGAGGRLTTHASGRLGFGKAMKGASLGPVIGGGIDLLERDISATVKAGGVVGNVAAWPVGAAVMSRLGGSLMGMGAAMLAELLVWQLFRMGAKVAEDANLRDAERMRQATRVGFQVSDVFHTNSRMMLTQRQESLRAIHQSVLNARSSIGNEAFLARKSVDDFLADNNVDVGHSHGVRMG